MPEKSEDAELAGIVEDTERRLANGKRLFLIYAAVWFLTTCIFVLNDLLFASLSVNEIPKDAMAAAVVSFFVAFAEIALIWLVVLALRKIKPTSCSWLYYVYSENTAYDEDKLTFKLFNAYKILNRNRVSDVEFEVAAKNLNGAVDAINRIIEKSGSVRAEQLAVAKLRDVKTELRTKLIPALQNPDARHKHQSDITAYLLQLINHSKRYEFADIGTDSFLSSVASANPSIPTFERIVLFWNSLPTSLRLFLSALVILLFGAASTFFDKSIGLPKETLFLGTIGAFGAVLVLANLFGKRTSE